MRWTKVLCIIICLLLLIGMIYFISIRKGDKEASLTVSNKTETVTKAEEKESVKAKEKEEKVVKSKREEKAKGENLKANEQNEQNEQKSLISKKESSQKEEVAKTKEETKEENLSLKNKENIIQKAKAIFKKEKETEQNRAKENENQNALKEQNETKKVQLEIKEILSLNKIEFETAKSSLTKKGKEIVAKIAVILKEHPNLKIKIAGHTDRTGDEAMNQKLSEARAKSVKDELIKLGIDPNRLIAKGYGSSKPLQKTDKKSQANRRVEFIIIGE